MHLVKCSIMLCLLIKSSTIDYLFSAETDITIKNKTEPLKSKHIIKAYCIDNALNKVKLLQSTHNQREPVNIKMVPRTYTKCVGQHLDRPDSILCDENVLGIF